MVSFWLKSHKMSSGQIHNISVIFFCHRTLHPEPKTYLLSGGYTVRKNTVVFAGPKTKLWNFSVSATGQSPSFNPYWQILENSSRIFFRNFSIPGCDTDGFLKNLSSIFSKFQFPGHELDRFLENSSIFWKFWPQKSESIACSTNKAVISSLE